MITIQIDGILAGDGVTPLTVAQQTLVTSGRKGYVIGPPGNLGLIDPNIYFQNPAPNAASSGVRDAGYRLDVAHIIQSGPSLAGKLQIVDLPGNVFVDVADLTLGAIVEVRSRSFPIPPGYALRIVSDTLTALRLGLTQLQDPADTQYFATLAPA